jgi:molecular chaperone GrpE
MTAPESQPVESLPQEDGLETASDAPVEGVAGDDVQRQLAEQQDRYLRLAAEYDNFRRRSRAEQREAGARAQAELVKHLIDALDDLARFAHVDPASTDATTVVQGVDMVERKLHKALGAAASR